MGVVARAVRGPSMSTTCLSVSLKTPCTRSRNPSSTPAASNRAKTRPSVLCEGIPFGGSTDDRQHGQH